MGLVVDIEKWPVSAAITMATEGVTANYGEVTSGGDGTADRKICKMLDKGKVLAAVDKLASHLSGWLLVAYAAPGYLSDARAQVFYRDLIGEFMSRYGDADFKLPEAKWERVMAIVPLICYDVARHGNDPRLHFSVAEYSAALVAGTDIKASTVRMSWKRDWLPAVDLIKSILYMWDELAKNGLRKEPLAI
ncbi:MAG: hypothetical protein ACRCR6_10565 [Plesiomonas sp.]